MPEPKVQASPLGLTVFPSAFGSPAKSVRIYQILPSFPSHVQQSWSRRGSRLWRPNGGSGVSRPEILTTKSVRTYSPNPSGFTILPSFPSVLYPRPMHVQLSWSRGLQDLTIPGRQSWQILPNRSPDLKFLRPFPFSYFPSPSGLTVLPSFPFYFMIFGHISGFTAISVSSF